MGRKRASHTQACPPNPVSGPDPPLIVACVGRPECRGWKVLSRPHFTSLVFHPHGNQCFGSQPSWNSWERNLGVGDECVFERNAALQYHTAALRMPKPLGNAETPNQPFWLESSFARNWDQGPSLLFEELCCFWDADGFKCWSSIKSSFLKIYFKSQRFFFPPEDKGAVLPRGLLR